QKAPEKRHPTARAMLEELERITSPQGALLSPAGAGWSDSLGRGSRFATLLVAAALIGVAATVFARRADAPRQTADTGATTRVAGAVGDSTVAPGDSVVRIGDTTRPAPVTGAQAPVVLSYEDSVSIARAMQRRTNSTLPINPDSLKMVFQRAMSDSAATVAEQIRRQVEGLHAQGWGGGRDVGTRVLVAPQLPPSARGKSRVVITDIVDGTPSQRLGEASRAFADSLRARLARDTSLEVVDAERTRSVATRVPNRAAAGWTLRADLMVTGHALARDEGMVVQLLVSDLRTGNVYVTTSDLVSLGDPLAALPSLMAKLTPRIEQMARASQRREVPRVAPPPAVPPAQPTPGSSSPPAR
ncbi:MAG TPA: hypothetical protein VMM77_08355, partial [Gemmatimonadaceae bacterium]|nr:hypothetical protein [Gemmatimonadaceae bacterium]